METNELVAGFIQRKYNKTAKVIKDDSGERIEFNGRITVVDEENNKIICDWNDGDHRKEYPLTPFSGWLGHWEGRLI